MKYNSAVQVPFQCCLQMIQALLFPVRKKPNLKVY